MVQRNQKYFIDKRKYAIRFVFTSKNDAKNFRLPFEYSHRFELNNNLDEDGSNFVRIAQVKLK